MCTWATIVVYLIWDTGTTAGIALRFGTTTLKTLPCTISLHSLTMFDIKRVTIRSHTLVIRKAMPLPFWLSQNGTTLSLEISSLTFVHSHQLSSVVRLPSAFPSTSCAY